MRPEVRIIEPQSEESKPVEVSVWEAEQLLRKYGHQEQGFSTRSQIQPPTPGLTFDEMIVQEELRLREEQLRRKQQMVGPKPVTFNGQNGYDSDVRYGSDSDSGFGFKIEITTDMNLPRY